MKTLSTLLVSLALTISYGYAQDTFIGSYMEITQSSPKAGVQLGRQFEYTIDTGGDGYRIMAVEVGVFYQTVTNSVLSPASESGVERNFQEEEFMGVFFGTRIAGFQNGSVYFNVRSGVTNRQNFAITPSLSAGYKITRHLEFNLGTGIRGLNPTVQGGLRLSL